MSDGSDPRSSSSAGSPATSPSTASTCRGIRPVTCFSCRSSTGSDSRSRRSWRPSRSPEVRWRCRRCWSRCARSRESHAPAPLGPSSPRRQLPSGWPPARTLCTQASARGRSRSWCSRPVARIDGATCTRWRWAAVRCRRIPLVRARPPGGDPRCGRPSAPAAPSGCRRDRRSRGRRRVVRARRVLVAAGLAATRARYHAGVASRRPYDAFLLANAACLAIATGPAIAVALARLRDRRTWLLVGGALLAIGVAAVSGMSKGEVERIWLPFTIWLLPAGAALAVSRRAQGWLAAQLLFAIGVQTLVRSPW